MPELPPAPPALVDLVDRVLDSPYVRITAWIDFAEGVDLPGRELALTDGAVRATGLEITIVEDENGERIDSVRAYGARLTQSGAVDGRSRAAMYDLLPQHHVMLMNALDGRPR